MMDICFEKTYFLLSKEPKRPLATTSSGGSSESVVITRSPDSQPDESRMPQSPKVKREEVPLDRDNDRILDSSGCESVDRVIITDSDDPPEDVVARGRFGSFERRK